jgi:hypothetical protein
VQDASLPPPEDATVSPTLDAATAPPPDATVIYPYDGGGDLDASYIGDAFIYPIDGSYCYVDLYGCPPGYSSAPGCNCSPCDNTCPAGQSPGPSCACTTCTVTCPAGFRYGDGCNCVPQGVDAGPMPTPDASDAGVTSCQIEGYVTFPAGSWYMLGVCPDGKTQYGCYCNADGTSTCSLDCPQSAACVIPGHPDCPPGSSCVYGSCADDPSGDLLVCSCSSYGGEGGMAYCYTASCADGGALYLPDAGGADGGVTCNLEGYITCPAGSFCPIGTCPDGTTQYGCTCNQDGRATCNLTCPPPPPCDIPGEGTCPYGSQCIFGCPAGTTTGTGLSCSCGYGTTASCFTAPCSQLATDGG